MSPVYRLTLVQLKPDAAGLGGAADKIEHGSYPVEEIIRLTGNLQRLDLSNPRAEPGIIVQRGEKGWRITVHQGRLRMHKSMSLFDDFWTVESPAELASLPPFQASASPASGRAQRDTRPPGRFQNLRAAGEIVGLFAAALVLVAIGLHFGLPQKRLSDLPADVTLVTSSDERANIFATVAGSYATGKAAGNSLVIISPDGHVALGTIGKDGKPTPPRLQEQARAARRGSVACVVTSFGIIAGIAPPDAVKVGNFQWKKAVLAMQ
jgi:hypothetical protein